MNYETCSRKEWDADEPARMSCLFPPWRIATWPERLMKIGVGLLGVVTVCAGFIGIVLLIAVIAENQGNRSSEYRRCLKHAETGYEIKRCEDPGFR